LLAHPRQQQCAQHQPSATWAFEKIPGMLSLVSNRTKVEVQTFDWFYPKE
jgi:hypothetical protein